MTKKVRDNFTAQTVKFLRERVNNFCSNPDCRRLTSEPKQGGASGINLTGVAAHICAASSLGPRYDESMSTEARKDISNGIWLCNRCARLIDIEPNVYPTELLQQWKKNAELRIFKNSNQKFSSETEVEKELHRALLKSRLQDFSAITNHSLSGMANAIHKELKLLDPRLDIYCSHLGNQTLYEIHAAESMQEDPVELKFKPFNNQEFQQKYYDLIAHGSGFECHLKEFTSNSEALNSLIPTNLKDGMVVLKPENKHCAILELTDENQNIILELDGTFISGNKSFSINTEKYDGLVKAHFKEISFNEKTIKNSNFDLSIDFSYWDGVELKRLPYFDKVKTIYKKLYEAKTLIAKVIVNGLHLYTAKSSINSDALINVVTLLEYVDVCKKISETMGFNILLESDITFTGDEHQRLHEVSELLHRVVEEKVFSCTMSLSKSKDGVGNLSEFLSAESIVIQQIYVVENLKIFNKLFNFNLYVQHIMINQKIKLLKYDNNKKISKYKICNGGDGSVYKRQVSITPFSEPDERVVLNKRDCW